MKIFDSSTTICYLCIHNLLGPTVGFWWLVDDHMINSLTIIIIQCCAGLHAALLTGMYYHWNELKFAFLHLDPSTHDGEEYKSEGIYFEADLPDEFKSPVETSYFFFCESCQTLPHVSPLVCFEFHFSCSPVFFFSFYCIFLWSFTYLHNGAD